MQPTTMFFAEFIAANGKPRYVGDGALMPWRKEEAKLFSTKQEALASLAKVAPHHRGSSFKRIGRRTVFMAYPVAMTAIGIDQPAKTPGQVAYETECAACPTYHDGSPRRAWHELDNIARASWETDPTPRTWAMNQAKA
jgi:hypothetical protein